MGTMTKAGWLQRFTEASPAEQREMLAAQRRQDGERLLRENGHGQAEIDRSTESTKRPQAVDLDRFPRDTP